MTTLPLFDASNLLKRIGGDRELVEEILNGFLEDLPKRFVLLRESIIHKDVVQVRRHAHSVKGAAMNIHALSLKKIAAGIEEAAQSRQLDEFEPLMSQLERQFQQLKVEIEKF